MAYENFTDFTRRIASDKVLRNFKKSLGVENCFVTVSLVE